MGSPLYASSSNFGSLKTFPEAECDPEDTLTGGEVSGVFFLNLQYSGQNPFVVLLGSLNFRVGSFRIHVFDDFFVELVNSW